MYMSSLCLTEWNGGSLGGRGTTESPAELELETNTKEVILITDR